MIDVREKLLRAAMRVFEESGTRGATTRRIAAEAGVNEITLFRHFGSKAALLSEALALAAADRPPAGLPAEPADPEAELTEWCRVGLDNLRAKRSMIRACMGEMESGPEMARCAGEGQRLAAAELEGYLQALRGRGMADPDLDHEAAAAMLMGSLFSDIMGRDMMPGRYSYSEAEAPARYVKLFLRAIGARAAPARTLVA